MTAWLAAAAGSGIKKTFPTAKSRWPVPCHPDRTIAERIAVPVDRDTTQEKGNLRQTQNETVQQEHVTDKLRETCPPPRPLCEPQSNRRRPYSLIQIRPSVYGLC
ncbi:hypothetical protein L596_002340 [Steinernema carpocapsae]|uniref:Uncharacterized protein n=1 Tax=Steinernema carpocapsae TaxID=34508 RepID=A0A4U8UPA9_STECR|nr:hypothetical protein L596_002340 [Steinernema carpocapsae]